MMVLLQQRLLDTGISNILAISYAIRKRLWVCLVRFQNMQAKDLASHDFSCYLVCYQSLPTFHTWLVKSMAIFFVQLLLDKSLA